MSIGDWALILAGGAVAYLLACVLEWLWDKRHAKKDDLDINF